MHQPQYRDPATGQYVLPWTRLHALKDYWGMVKTLEEFPNVHATFNMVPTMVEQIEEYASGQFKEPWFDIVFARADSLTPEQKREALERAFQVNDNLVRRWPRFVKLQAEVRSGGAEACVAHWGAREWRDLQVLSQLAWMDEEYLAKDPVVRGLSEAGRRHDRDVPLLIECDTGFGRNGVQSPEAALSLARYAMNMPRIRFEGLMTFPTRGATAAEFLNRSLDLFRTEGIPVPVVSGGGTPALLDLARWLLLSSAIVVPATLALLALDGATLLVEKLDGGLSSSATARGPGSAHRGE
jgi:hypothetical protein